MWRILDIILLFTCFAGVVPQERKLNTLLNPECGPACIDSDIIVVYTRADGPHDAVHHLWSTVGGRPAVAVAVTPLESHLSIDWTRFIGEEAPFGSVTFSPNPPTTIFAFIIDKIIEFNDSNNTGRLDESRSDVGYVILTRLDGLNWTLSSWSATNSSATLEGRFTTGTPGIVRISLSAFEGDGHGNMLPHLYHTGNATQVDLMLDSVVREAGATSRLALNFVTLAAPAHSPMHISNRRTLDDEHSPGIFEVTEVLTSDEDGNSYGNLGGYLQWKNVSYSWPVERTMTNSTVLQNYPVSTSVDDEDVKGTLVGALLPADSNNTLPIAFTSFNVSIGAKGDGFYRKTNYATWTLLAGVGRPVEEQFSTIVLVVLVVGLGLPALLIITGVCCIVVRRFTKRTNEIILSQ